MSDYVPTIGLEIHAELKTRTKMFCGSKNDPDETRPNVNVCPVCLAHPGTLPVINREAVKHVLKVGLAVGGKIADYTEFDRKNYFYPDLPKGYQLSQYEYPLVSGGELGGVALTRIHLEEDTASSVHEEGTNTTTIDFNRSGVPLMELVTEPVIHSVEEAGNFARELQLLLRYLGVSDANMEKGEMRVEANVSVAKINKKQETRNKLGTKVEIKNLNSFKAMERAVAHEIKRQTKRLERNEKVIQETLGWDEGKQATFPQRVKEGSADYRYFPDPDLPSLMLSEIPDFALEELRRAMPELPWERRQRYISLGIKSEDAELYVRERKLGAFFDEVVALLGSGNSKGVLLASNYIANDLVKIIRDIEQRDSGYQSEIPISARNFKAIIDMQLEGKILSRSAKNVLLACTKGAGDPLIYAEGNSLLLNEDSGSLSATIDQILERNSSVVADYKSGKAAALEFLVGLAMKELRGAADPIKLRQLLDSRIKPEKS
ncbi:glutaminyl-tRNA synthase (glutamine-hydrolyzing) subunit B [Candidatus Kaiserbacteria bacterium RIFCSPLOWO2_01_FULL_54_20]|uniref:Aspartyl/glutamyl-tRNA(Asn/Gln) amidotransferase subunit B n=1 Tax=Candidatus Kaiserbacteria bacterium RIFCSPLOWO2_01_FULL_54_20 TaxID=1798513 RepID=A0A1F6EJT4_9BACT|nr:MAG: glutaminyl-tRNA synthase (glutamine-hydrolyzing) subunit B [Candidatus Kaiserbacteria bacterium RIFCSPLOWO2_01_FULL_54_20]